MTDIFISYIRLRKKNRKSFFKKKKKLKKIGHGVCELSIVFRNLY